MFGRKKKTTGRNPERRWSVGIADGVIAVRDHTGDGRSIALDALSGVVIETNDGGPWSADVWWLFFGADERMACAFPQGATGERAVIDILTALPGFDHGEMIKAMTSTGNATFLVWRRPAGIAA